MALLNGGLANVLGSVFNAVYLPATLHRITRVDDGLGSVATSSASESVRAQMDIATEAMRGQSGYTDTDVRLLILAKGIAQIDTDCELELNGRRYAIASVDQDPATAYYDCRGQAI